MFDYEILKNELVFEDKSLFGQCHASTVVACMDGTLCVAFFGGTKEGNSDVAIYSCRYVSGSWTAPVKIADVKDTACWNPVLFEFDDRLVAFFKAGEKVECWHTMFVTSYDCGKTWSSPEVLVDGDIGGRGPVKNKPIRLSNGVVAAPASIEQTDKKWFCFVDLTSDGGKSWQKSNIISTETDTGGIIQPSLWQGKDNELNFLARSTFGYLYKSTSKDFGKSFSKPVKTDIPNNNSGIDLVKLCDGTLFLVYNNVSGNWAARDTIGFCVSNDNGETFGKYVELEYEKGAEFSYPAVIADGNDIYITYTHKRKSIKFLHIRRNAND